MVLPSLLVLAVLAVVAAARIAFAVGHASVYLALSRAFGRGRGRLARAGQALSRLAVALPVVNLGFDLVRMVATYQEMPPGGMRRVIELPVMVFAWVVVESLAGLAVGGVLLALLWWQGRRR